MTTFLNENGSEFRFYDGVGWNATNPLEDNAIYHLYPQKGSGKTIISASITEGTKITHLYASEITYEKKTQNFLLKNNAKIIQGKNILKGPVKIEFDSQSNTMVAIGTNENPAYFYYINEAGKPIVSKNKQFIFHFKEIDGKRKLNDIEGPYNKGTIIPLGGRDSNSSNPIPRLSK